MNIDDKLSKAIQDAANDTEPFVGKEAFNAALSAVPVIGAPVLSVISDLTLRRIRERLLEVVRIAGERLNKLDSSKVDTDFLGSEEFQTIFFRIYEQLRTTHKKEKLRMLSSALANSCTREFSAEERKELFLIILRDLSLSHVQLLKSMQPLPEKEYSESNWRHIDDPFGETLALLQTLHANGLVRDYLTNDRQLSSSGNAGSDRHNAVRAINEALRAVPKRHFRISRFGISFLKYLREEDLT